jgi:hypothetical protein
MISYLSGDALGWFKPFIVDPDPENVSIWLNNYDTFVSELQINFGTSDPRQEAEKEIVALWMGKKQHIQKYLVRFNKLSQLMGWNSVALRKVFYDGLPEHNQIKLCDLPSGKPTSLDVLKISALSIDASHWEWRREQELRRARNPQTSAKSLGTNSKSTSNDSSMAQAGDSKKKNKKKGSRGNGGNSGGSSAQTLSSLTSEKPYTKVLGSDGKLLPTEKA